LNFGINLRKFEFVYSPSNLKSIAKKKQYPKKIENVFRIKKTNVLLRIRRLLGIPNIRIKFTKNDMLFTYGTLLISNKPYCIYIENGLALFNYDLTLSKNPIAIFLLRMAIRMKNFKKIIFMSQTAEKSFYSTLKLNHRDEEIIRQKSVQCYPLIKNPLTDAALNIFAKRNKKNIKFLFTGTFYIKGGLEIINAFSELRKKYANIKLTMICDSAIKPEDKEKIKNISEIEILESGFSEKEMFEKFYNTHDIFLMPTFRDSFCLVLIEALSAGMPIIANDQFAIKEMVIDSYNGFLFPDHPLKDYNSKTYELYGRLSEPINFYNKLFKFQEDGKTKPVEKFLYDSMEKFILNPALIEKFSQNSLELYNKKFRYDLISDRIESIFLEAIEK
jgi:glycosyltransferase involved in cell wall biosynthesis